MMVADPGPPQGHRRGRTDGRWLSQPPRGGQLAGRRVGGHLGDELLVPGQVGPAVDTAVGAVGAGQVAVEGPGGQVGGRGQAAPGGGHGGWQGPGRARGGRGHRAPPAEPLAGEAAQQSAESRRSSRAEVGGAPLPRAPPGEKEVEKGGGLQRVKGGSEGGALPGPPSPIPPALRPAPPPPRCQLRPGQLITGVRGSTVVAPPRPCCPQGDPGGGPQRKRGQRGTRVWGEDEGVCVLLSGIWGSS